MRSLSPEQPSTEGRRVEERREQSRLDPFATEDLTPRLPSDLGRLSEDAHALLAGVPRDRTGKSAWLRAVARDEEITLHLARRLAVDVDVIGQPFACVLHGACAASLSRGRNGEIVYHDPSLASLKREFQTLVELAVAVKTGMLPQRLRPLQLALWRLRLLHEAGVVDLPPARVPDVAPASAASVRQARDGFELLIRCRWFLDAGEPVTYTRSFIEVWAGVARNATRRAIFELLQQRVIVKVGETESGYKRAAHLYRPGTRFALETRPPLEQ